MQGELNNKNNNKMDIKCEMIEGPLDGAVYDILNEVSTWYVKHPSEPSTCLYRRSLRFPRRFYYVGCGTIEKKKD